MSDYEKSLGENVVAVEELDNGRKAITLRIDGEMAPKEEMKKAIASNGRIIDRLGQLSIVDYGGNYSYYPMLPKAIKLPTEPHAQMALAREIYFSESIVRTAIDLMVDFSISGFKNDSDNEEIKAFYDEWCRKVNMIDVLRWIFLEFYRSGNVTIYKSMNKPKKAGRPKKLQSKNPLYGKNYPVGYTVLNPLYVWIEGPLLFNQEVVTVRLPQDAQNYVADNMFNSELIDNLPGELKKAFKSGGQRIVLDQDLVSRITRKRQPYERYATPFLYSVFEPVIIKEKLRMMDLSTIEGMINQLVTVTVGNDEYPADDEQLKAIAELFNTPNKAYCWKAGTKILMSDYTEKNVEDIKIGDEVITHLGNKTRVLSTNIRPSINEGRKIKVFGYDREFDMTHDHKLFVVKRDSLRCVYRKKNDGRNRTCFAYFCGVTSKNKPCIYCKNPPEPIIEKLKAEELREGDFLLFPLTNIHSENNSIIVSDFIGYEPKLLNSQYEVTHELMKILGYFVTKGSYMLDKNGVHQGLYLTLSKKRDSRYIREIKRIFRDFFNVDYKTYICSKDQDSLIVQIKSKELADLFLSLVGDSNNRKLNQVLMTIEPEVQLSFIAGFMSDDSFSRNDPISNIRMNTSYEELARQVYQILLRNKMKPTIENSGDLFIINIFGEDVAMLNKYIPGKHKKVKKGKLIKQFIYKDFLASPITEITTYKSNEEAYGFFVEADEHSYIANGIASSNTLFWNHTLDVKFHKPEGLDTLISEKYEQLDRDILAGLGIARVLIDGVPSKGGSSGGSGGSAWVSILSLIERLENGREQVKRWLEEEYRKIAEMNGFETYPTPRFDKMNLRQDTTIKNVLLAMYDRGLLSKETLLTETNYDFEVEKFRKKDEEPINDLFAPPTLPYSGDSMTPKDGQTRQTMPNEGRPVGSGGNYPEDRETLDKGGDNIPKVKASSNFKKATASYRDELEEHYEILMETCIGIAESEDDEEEKRNRADEIFAMFYGVMIGIGYKYILDSFDEEFGKYQPSIDSDLALSRKSGLRNWHEGYVDKFVNNLKGFVLENINDSVSIEKKFNSEHYRIKLFAQEGTRNGYLQGLIAGNMSIGAVRAIWRTASDDRVCPICRAFDGRVFEINRIPLIPVHPNCRCNLDFEFE